MARTLQGVRGVAEHGLDPRGFQRHAVERAPGNRLFVARADPFLAKILLAAGEEPQIVAHAVAVMSDKSR